MTFFRDAINAAADTNKIVFTDVGSGSVRIWSSKPIASGWPDAVLFLDGPFVSASLKMAQCEGFPNIVKVGSKYASESESGSTCLRWSRARTDSR